MRVGYGGLHTQVLLVPYTNDKQKYRWMYKNKYKYKTQKGVSEKETATRQESFWARFKGKS